MFFDRACAGLWNTPLDGLRVGRPEQATGCQQNEDQKFVVLGRCAGDRHSRSQALDPDAGGLPLGGQVRRLGQAPSRVVSPPIAAILGAGADFGAQGVGAPFRLLKNQGVRRNSVWVRLEGVKSNRSAIGARVTLEAGGRRQMQEVLAGGSYYSQNELALHFGLSDAKTIDKLEVRWPAGEVQAWEGLDANHKYNITEGRREFSKTAYRKP